MCDLNVDEKIVINVDTTCLLFSDNSWKGVYNKAPSGLQLAAKDLNKRGLSLNYGKTMCMKYSINKGNKLNDPITLHNCNNSLNCNLQD